jgi:hypothetical protein
VDATPARAIFVMTVMLCASACDSTPSATLQLDLGGETGVFTQDPAPTTIEVDVVDSTGAKKTLYSGPINDTITLADEDQNAEGYIDLFASDAAGNVQVRGRSVPITFDSISDSTLDLFVQRTGQLARMPGNVDLRQAPLVDTVGGQYILVAGGGSASTTLYDLLNWAPLSAPPTLPTTPKSLAVSGASLLLIDDTGGTSYDLTDSTSTAITQPQGGMFAEVIGGSTVYGSDGTAYVVGGTRTTGDPTARVLKVATDGTLSFVNLSAARLGAAAVWVEGRGVVVVGGSASAPGVEILGGGGTSAAALAYAPISSATLSAASIDATHVVAGLAPVVIDLSCAASCAPAAWAKPAVAFTHADYFPLPALTTDVLAVGWDANGDTHVFRITQMTATEIALKVPRKQARGVALPNGAIAVVGGAAQGESFFP